MSIKDKIHNEQIELNGKWLETRKKGQMKYILFGSIRCLAFIGAAMLIYSAINNQFSYNQIIATIISSIIIPVLSWYGNEIRLRLLKK